MKIKFLLTILLFAVGVAACTPKEMTIEQPLTIVDALDRQIQFARMPSRIAIVGRQTPMLTHFFYLFETASEKIIAIEGRSQQSVAFISLIDENIDEKYTLERGATAEQITPLNLDAVVMKTVMRESVGLQLEELGIPVVYIEFESFDDIYRDLRIFASLLNEPNHGEEIINRYQQMEAEVNDSIQAVELQEIPTVLVLQSVKEDQIITFSVPSSSWLQTVMVESLGAIPVWKDAALGGGWSDVNLEQIAAWDPDIVLIVNYRGHAPEIVRELKADDIWKQMRSVQNNRIYPFIFDYISWDQPDPRWIVAYSWLAYRIFPNHVSEEMVINHIEEFFGNFFGIKDPQFFVEMEQRLSDYF